MSYLLKSRTSFYSFLFTLPLFFLYEVNILFLSWDDILVVRNGADFLMRNILESFDIYGLYGLGLVFFLGLLVTYIFFIKEDQKQEVNVNFLFIMLAESMLWSVFLYFLLFKFMVLLMNPVGKTILQQVTLAIGAGIYEEFLFRVLLIAGLSGILGFVFMWDKTFKTLLRLYYQGEFSPLFILWANMEISFQWNYS